MSDERWDADSADDAELWERLARYSAGESNEAEVARVRAWLAEDPSRAELLEALDRTVARLKAPPADDVDVEAALRRVHERIRADDAAPAVSGVRPIHTAPGRRREPRAWPATTNAMRVAAALVLLLGGALLWTQLRRPAEVPQLAAAIHTTAVGQLDSLRLMDGTMVWLGPDSRLVVPGEYGAEQRVVELNGVALFDVIHDDAQPFTVHAGGHTIRDLGTTFSVKTGDDGVQVVVTSGEVLLGSGPDARAGVSLRAGDRGEVDRAGRASVERGVVTDAHVAWARGQLVFDDVPLGRVADDLRRWYGIELTWTDPALADRRLTAIFERETADQVLAVIEAVLGARIERRGDTAILRLQDGAR